MRSGTRLAPAFALLGSIALGIWLVLPRTRDPLSFDALHTYLPMARSLIEQGWAFMQRPESLATAPIGYLYPALLGADGTTVRWANVFLYAATIALGFEVLRVAHSWRAGAIGAFLLALSPTIHPYVADALTEMPFMFLMMVWAWAVAKIATFSRAIPEGKGGMTWILVGGAALALATLTRPAVMYFAPVMVVALWVARQQQRRLEALHWIALAGSVAWIARNTLAFGFPGVATGAGAALFLGINPLVDGFDPGYFGLVYDQGAASGDPNHLSIEADRLLRAIALVELRDTPLAVIVEMFARKTLAFLFVGSSVTLGEPVLLLRTWRIVLVVLALAAVLARRRSPFVLTLGALVVYMLAVHMPVLYQHRYSVGALDIPLTLLAAIGLAEMAVTPARMALAAVATTLALGIGWTSMEPGPSAPRIERTPAELIWAADARELATIRAENANRTGPAIFQLGASPAVEIPVPPAPRFHPWDMTMVTLAMAITPSAKGDCAAMKLRYRKPDDAGFPPERVTRVRLQPDGRMHPITVGAAIPLALNHAGVLRLEFECAYPATLEMGTISIAAPRRATYYREKYLKEKS